MKKLLLVGVWLPASFMVIMASLYLTAHPDVLANNKLTHTTNLAYASVLGAFQSRIVSADARPGIVARFLEQYNCPLKPYDHYAQEFVAVADSFNLDFRLLPAISMQESNCCLKTPDGSNNCWGYGIYGDHVVRFNSIEDGMKTVAGTLAKSYANKGLLEPIDIMGKYTPQSQGSWALNVTHFMEQMR